jgi:hypothetical protein
VAAFYSPDVVQEEFPNAFLPNGARRSLTGLQELTLCRDLSSP